LIFWSATGGCGVATGEGSQGATKLIKKAVMALAIQPPKHAIHQMSTLSAMFMGAVFGRLINLDIRLWVEAERALAKEDELRGDEADEPPREYGVRTFVPRLSVTLK
jgi:hypothetical protein